MKHRMLLGITSSIAAYKAVYLVKKLQARDIEVRIIMTANAAKMINPNEFQKLGVTVYTQLFPEEFTYEQVLSTRHVEHIALADTADLMAIIPATANTIAKLASGMADDLLTTTALAFTKPIIIAPAMNTNMWNNPLTQENIAKLQNLGHIIIEPTEGMLACGYTGKGKLENIEIIYQEIIDQLSYANKLKNKKFIVTAGGTTEPIDTVRVITNKSSGKMGVALAEALFLQGAEVLLLRATHAVKPRFLIKEKTFTTSTDLLSLIKQFAPKYDVIYHAAAVSDFSVTQETTKLSSQASHTLLLTPQIKILDEIKKLNSNIQLFAFKAVDNENDLVTKAKETLLKSNADGVIANNIAKKDNGFESENNEVCIVTKNKDPKHFTHKSKKELAKEIVTYLSEV